MAALDLESVRDSLNNLHINYANTVGLEGAYKTWPNEALTQRNSRFPVAVLRLFDQEYTDSRGENQVVLTWYTMVLYGLTQYTPLNVADEMWAETVPALVDLYTSQAGDVLAYGSGCQKLLILNSQERPIKASEVYRDEIWGQDYLQSHIQFFARVIF